METAEFEEKDYEGPLYNQLLFGNHRISTPGQVFENAFGLDAALEANHPNFWDFFNYTDVPNGIYLSDYGWGWVWRRYGKHRDLPNFPVNLLIQAKRPDYLLGRNHKIASHGITKDYWRFKVREHQQPLLYKLERQLRNRALVVYASSAFHTLYNLNKFTENKTIVENSTFVRPTRLIGHHSWNYDQPGTFGVATTEPKLVKDESFFTQLEKRLSSAPIDTTPIDDLRVLSNSIMGAVKRTQNNPISQSYMRRAGLINELDVKEETRQYLSARYFFELTNITWLVAGNIHKR